MMARQKKSAKPCDHNCFECPFLDCIADDMTPEEWRESQRRNRDTHLDTKKKRQRAYREANRDKIAESKRAYYKANRDKIAESQRAYREANRDKIAESKRAYREARRWAGLTQTAVADALGISQSTYSLWETGAVPSDYNTVMGAIARLARCSVEMLEERPLLV